MKVFAAGMLGAWASYLVPGYDKKPFSGCRGSDPPRAPGPANSRSQHRHATPAEIDANIAILTGEPTYTLRTAPCRPSSPPGSTTATRSRRCGLNDSSLATPRMHVHGEGDPMTPQYNPTPCRRVNSWSGAPGPPFTAAACSPRPGRRARAKATPKPVPGSLTTATARSASARSASRRESRSRPVTGTSSRRGRRLATSSCSSADTKTTPSRQLEDRHLHHQRRRHRLPPVVRRHVARLQSDLDARRPEHADLEPQEPEDGQLLRDAEQDRRQARRRGGAHRRGLSHLGLLEPYRWPAFRVVQPPDAGLGLLPDDSRCGGEAALRARSLAS